MECKNCGTQFPEDTNFCSSCGKPQTDGAAGGLPKWEICVIDFSVEEQGGFLKSPKIKLVAQVMNPYGEHITATSPVINGERVLKLILPPEKNQKDREAAIKALDDLWNELVKRGWKMTGTTGQKYWQLRLLRQLNKYPGGKGSVPLSQGH